MSSSTKNDKTSWIVLIRQTSSTGSADGVEGVFRQEGPLSTEEIMRKIEVGELKATDHLWKSGFKQWVPVREIEELKAPPLPPPVAEVVIAPTPTPAAAPMKPIILEATKTALLPPRKGSNALKMAVASLVLLIVVGSVYSFWQPEPEVGLEQIAEVAVEPQPLPLPEVVQKLPVKSPVETKPEVKEAPKVAAEKTTPTPLPFDPNRMVRFDFLEAQDPLRMKIKITGNFRAKESIKLRLQARPGDILGRVAHFSQKSWSVGKDGEFEGPLGSMSLSRGRYNYALMVGERMWKGTVEVGKFDISQLKDQLKRNSYFVQSERKKLWKALDQLEQTQRSGRAAKSRGLYQAWTKWPEFKSLNKSQNTLAFPEAWQEFSKLLESLIASPDGRKPASAPQVVQARKKLRLEALQGISLEDF